MIQIPPVLTDEEMVDVINDTRHMKKEKRTCTGIGNEFGENLRAVAKAQDAKTLSSLQAPDREKIARLIFDNEYDLPKEWDWKTIKEHAPISSIKCEVLADQITPLFEASKQRAVEEAKIAKAKEIFDRLDENLFYENDGKDIEISFKKKAYEDLISHHQGE